MHRSPAYFTAALLTLNFACARPRGADSSTSSTGTTDATSSETTETTTTPGTTTSIETSTTSTTTPAAECGNGVLEGDEECDDGNDDDSDDCTSLCKPATCGDGFVQAGVEECDDGDDDDSDECPTSCKPATCGDGYVQAGVEECDDGNSDDTDACVGMCKHASCGDGLVQAGVEDCDDGDDDNADECSNACEAPRVMFVTSADYKGNLGGLTGADALCQAAADAVPALQGKTFKAWLSDDTGSPSTRFDTAFGGRYVLVDDTTIATGWADLTDGTLEHAVDSTETGTPVSSGPWTNTKADGTALGADHCENWSVGMFGPKGAYGTTTATDATWTDAGGTSLCSGAFPLYCMEDPSR